MTRTRSVLALLLAAAIWGATFPLIKAALADVSSLVFNGLRFGLATLLLAPSLRRLRGPALRAGLMLGLFLSVGFAVQTVGLETTTPSRSAFLTALYAPFTPLVAVALGGPRPSWRSLLAVAIALGGTLLLTGAYQDGGSLSTGDWLTIGCAACFAIQIVLAGSHGASQNQEDLLVAQVLGAALFGIPMVPLFETARLHWSPVLIAALGVEVFLATLLCLRLQLAGQRMVTTTEAAVLFAIEPVVAALTSRWTLGEQMSGVQLAGAALIMTALLIPALDRGRSLGEQTRSGGAS